MEERKGFGSNFGFLMASVGSAVGLGNIWGFPNKMAPPAVLPSWSCIWCWPFCAALSSWWASWRWAARPARAWSARIMC